jgi:hypothetical protein
MLACDIARLCPFDINVGPFDLDACGDDGQAISKVSGPQRPRHYQLAIHYPLSVFSMLFPSDRKCCSIYGDDFERTEVLLCLSDGGSDDPSSDPKGGLT